MDTQIIEREFDKSLIKTRKGRSGISLSYVETPEYIKRLNEAFDYNWSFEIEEERIEGGFVIVRGRLTANGISKCQYGSSQLTVGKERGEPISVGDDYKAACSDALKKTSSLFGIGLHLYNGRNNGSGMSRTTGNKGNGNVTKAQLSKIKSLRTGLGMSSDDIIDLLERMYDTRDPKELNKEMASAIISVLEKQEDESDKPTNDEVV